MKRYLVAALVVLALFMVTVSGPTMAKKGGNKAEAKVCRTQYDDLGFKNRGACGRIFTQAPDGFAEACSSLGGFVEEVAGVATGRLEDNVWLVPACSFGGVEVVRFRTVLFPGAPWRTICAKRTWGFWYRGGGLIGCDARGTQEGPVPSNPDADFAAICSDNHGSTEGKVFTYPWTFSAACAWSASSVGDPAALEVLARPLLRHCSNGLRWLMPVGDQALAGCPDHILMTDRLDDLMLAIRQN